MSKHLKQLFLGVTIALVVAIAVTLTVLGLVLFDSSSSSDLIGATSNSDNDEKSLGDDSSLTTNSSSTPTTAPFPTKTLLPSGSPSFLRSRAPSPSIDPTVSSSATPSRNDWDPTQGPYHSSATPTLFPPSFSPTSRHPSPFPSMPPSSPTVATTEPSSGSNDNNTDFVSSFSNRFIFCFLPDTQYYSEGAPYIFEAQTQWLADYQHVAYYLGHPENSSNTASSSLIGTPPPLFVMHLGDLVQSASKRDQWEAAKHAMNRLAADANDVSGNRHSISFSVAPGNHDLLDSGFDDQRNTDVSPEPYLQYFAATASSPQQQEQQRERPTLQGRDPLGYSEYHLVTIVDNNNFQFLVLALDWRASDTTLAWAQQVLDHHARIPTIVMSHEFLKPQSTGVPVVRTQYGNRLWNSFLSKANQIFLIVCGHLTGSGYRIDMNDNGQPVVSLLCDYQELHAGGNGYLRLVEFDFLNGTMDHLTFSPFLWQLYNSQQQKQQQQQKQSLLSPYDAVQLKDSSNDLVVEFDFLSRFRDMDALNVPPQWNEWQSTEAFKRSSTATLMSSSSFSAPSRLDLLRSILEEIPQPLPLESHWAAPRDSDDFPQNIQDTLAHWRFDVEGISPGTPVSPLDVISDVAGGEYNLIRQDLGFSQPDYMTWSDDHHFLSSSPGSICFSSPLKYFGSFFTTTAKITSATRTETFEDGFTIEAFVKLASTWENGLHAWSGIVSRNSEGQNGATSPEGVSLQGDLKEPLAVLGVSPSREVQFASFPTHPTTSVTRSTVDDTGDNNKIGMVTAWSSPLEENTWYHLAVVNDGQSTKLYVDGFPARRDPVHVKVKGITAPVSGGGWNIGASSYDGTRKVFGGCIGEVRIATRALETNEFLLARRTEAL